MKEVDYYDLSDEQEEDPVTNYLTNDLKSSLKSVEVTINNKVKVRGVTFKTLKLDLQPFLHIFKADLIKKGLKLI